MYEKTKYYIAKTEDFHKAITWGGELKVMAIKENDAEPVYTTLSGMIISVTRNEDRGFLITTEETKSGYLQLYLI